MKYLRIALKIILPILVLAFGVGVVRALVSMREAPPRKAPTEVAQPVRVVTPTAAEGAASVRALGTVGPARQIALQAQVGGRIDSISEGFVPGGLVGEGEVLVQLDKRDYWLQIQQAKAQVKRAEVALKQERSRKAVAEREWKLLGDKATASERGRALALREPQIAGAQADVDAAKSQRDQAGLSLQRTTIKAPFNSVVRSENVDVGQIAAPGVAMGTLIGTDTWWVQVSVPASELKWLTIPGGAARITLDPGDGDIVERRGTVIRQLADVDPSGMMARIIVEVDDPMALTTPEVQPLLLGASVNVEMDGRPVRGVVAIPREALRDGDVVWTVGEGDVLEPVNVVVARRERSRVLVRGLAADARVVRSRISAPVTGMKLAPTSDAPAKVANAEPADAKPAGAN